MIPVGMKIQEMRSDFAGTPVSAFPHHIPAAIRT
jgi:hypothetical protein